MSGTRQARPRRGRRVSFTRADAESSPQQTNTVVGLRFTVEAAHGGSALIDFVHLRPRRLALAFASALRELAPTVVRSTLIQHANGLKRFFGFLKDTAAKPDGPEQPVGADPARQQRDGFAVRGHPSEADQDTHQERHWDRQPERLWDQGPENPGGSRPGDALRQQPLEIVHERRQDQEEREDQERQEKRRDDLPDDVAIERPDHVASSG